MALWLLVFFVTHTADNSGSSPLRQWVGEPGSHWTASGWGCANSLKRKKKRKIMPPWLPVLAMFTCKHVTAHVIIMVIT